MGKIGVVRASHDLLVVVHHNRQIVGTAVRLGLAGRLAGDNQELDQANRVLALELGQRCLQAGRPLLHVGSAAE